MNFFFLREMSKSRNSISVSSYLGNTFDTPHILVQILYEIKGPSFTSFSDMISSFLKHPMKSIWGRELCPYCCPFFYSKYCYIGKTCWWESGKGLQGQNVIGPLGSLDLLSWIPPSISLQSHVRYWNMKLSHPLLRKGALFLKKVDMVNFYLLCKMSKSRNPISFSLYLGVNLIPHKFWFKYSTNSVASLSLPFKTWYLHSWNTPWRG